MLKLGADFQNMQCVPVLNMVLYDEDLTTWISCIPSDVRKSNIICNIALGNQIGHAENVEKT